MSDAVQRTLAGDELAIDDDRLNDRPTTLVTCPDCGEVLFRYERHDHPHDVFAEPDDGGDGGDGGDEDEPERIGAVYDITLEYTTTYRFRVPAYSEHEAKERARDLQLDARPADAYLVHTDEREVKEILSDDDLLPDDFDVYDGTPVWEVYGDDE
jgi:predicted  nucleic acid-binding Zn-ribbon protein